MKKIFLSLITLFLVTACTDDDVMNELESNTFNSNLTTSYWTQQIKENSSLWQKALPYCQANPIKVNCATLRQAWVDYNIQQHMAANAANNPNSASPIARRIRQRMLNNT